MSSTNNLTVKIFADGADKADMLNLYQDNTIQGFTTNPTLMRKAGISDYSAFAKDILQIIHDRPISFEVFSDDFKDMYKQALEIASWGKNVYVKIPVTNSLGESSIPLINSLAQVGIKQNVTALMTLNQVSAVTEALSKGPSAYISVFAGRIADTGRDPIPLMQSALAIMQPYPQLELIWASPRELLNIFHASDIGCHIITVTHDLLKKRNLINKCLDEYSLDTVKMFRDDAVKAGFKIEVEQKALEEML